MLTVYADAQLFGGREGLQWEDPGKRVGQAGIKRCLVPGITLGCVEINLD